MTVYDDRCLCRGLWFWLEAESIKPVTSMEPRRMMDGVKSITKYIIKKTSDIFSASTGLFHAQTCNIYEYSVRVSSVFSLCCSSQLNGVVHIRDWSCASLAHITPHIVRLFLDTSLWNWIASSKYEKKKWCEINGYLVAIIASTISYLVI